MSKLRFALYFGNRGFFPETLISGARQEFKETVEKLGFETLMMDENETRYGAVETVEDGRKYADFLRKQKLGYDGVI